MKFHFYKYQGTGNDFILADNRGQAYSCLTTAQINHLCNRRFGIVPGKPAESILLFRMQSDDTGIRMPELGRQLAHREGLDLIESWIKNMK